MSGKPAARLSDPTACPIPGHGTNPIAAGSPNVLFDNLPAARQGDASACGGALASAVIPTVLINGKPATTVGTVGSHGNVVVAGSGTVIIGTSGGGAAFSGLSAMPATAVAAAATSKASASAETSTTATAATAVAKALVGALIPAAQAAEASSEELDYQLSLKPGGNRILTPLEIPDYAELEKGTTKNSEKIEFVVRNRKQPADSLTLEVLDDSTLLYAEPNTATLLPTGEHLWQWDGYNQAGVLDTKVLKSSNLKVRLTAVKGGQQQIVELKLSNKAKEADWVDSKIDRNAGIVEVTLRPSFSDGGIDGKNPALTPLSYVELEALAKQGIEHYWSRDGSRAQGIAAPINTSKGIFSVKTKVVLNAEAHAATFRLISDLSEDGTRSTSFAMFKKISHNLGWWFSYRSHFHYYTDAEKLRLADLDAKEDFKNTAAHEFGHLILNEYGGGLIPGYSWRHKATSSLLQNAKDNNDLPKQGEVDVMHYFSDDIKRAPDQDRWNRTSAAAQDVSALIWLTRVKLDD